MQAEVGQQASLKADQKTTANKLLSEAVEIVNTAWNKGAAVPVLA